MISAYIAGSFTSQERLKKERERLIALGFKITSSWLDESSYDPPKNALNDLADLDQADYLIIDTIEPSTTGGRDVEFGYALEQGKGIIIVGSRINLFHHLISDEDVLPTWDALVETLSDYKREG